METFPKMVMKGHSDGEGVPQKLDRRMLPVAPKLNAQHLITAILFDAPVGLELTPVEIGMARSESKLHLRLLRAHRVVLRLHLRPFE